LSCQFRSELNRKSTELLCNGSRSLFIGTGDDPKA
jgi:hypothetical protein